jgi:hypothetical protein
MLLKTKQGHGWKTWKATCLIIREMNKRGMNILWVFRMLV